MKIVLLATSIMASSLAADRPALAGSSGPNDEDDRHYAARGVDMMMDGDLDGAIEVFQQIEQKDPDSPVGFVLEANVTWWKIYYVSANLIDPDVFDVANMEATPYDSHFDDLDNVAIRKAEARIHLHQDLARSFSTRVSPMPCAPGWKACTIGTCPPLARGRRCARTSSGRWSSIPALRMPIWASASTTTLSTRSPASLNS